MGQDLSDRQTDLPWDIRLRKVGATAAVLVMTTLLLAGCEGLSWTTQTRQG
jgi:hypothetical protein